MMTDKQNSGGASMHTPTADERLGMLWWNRCTKSQRAHWLAVADSARPVDAWRAFSRGEK